MARPGSRRAAVTLALLLLSSCKPGCESLRASPRGAKPPPSAAKRSCLCGDWLTYGHDAQRTSASPGCCTSALRELWRFAPEPKDGRKASLHHAVATAQAVFVSGVIGDSPALYRLSPEGELVWVFDSRVDITHAHWPVLGHDHVILNDDGLYVVDPATGRKLFDRELDSWGQVITDPARLYLVDELHVDGPRVLVGAFDPQGHGIWQQNVSGSVQEDVRDAVGAIALSGGTLFQAADYRFIPFWGLFAFDGTTGTPRWNVDARPTSGISVGGGRLFLTERATRDGPEALTARSELTGEVVWSTPVQGLDRSPPALLQYRRRRIRGPPPARAARPEKNTGGPRSSGKKKRRSWMCRSGEEDPGIRGHRRRNLFGATGNEVLVSNLVVTFSHESGLAARSAESGEPVWSRPIEGSGGEATENATHVAAAVGSDTLVVASGTAVSVVAVQDGSVLWRSEEPDGANPHLHSPVIAHGRVYLIANGEVRALECAPDPP